jgi:2Fe-2S ferredoxin
VSRLVPVDDMEEGMLETAWERRANSRLSCQVEITPALDGLEVRVPQRQASN